MPALKQDDELDRLEEDIRRVKNKYDQFFAGISKVPPMQDRRNLEIFIYELSKQKIRDNARRFRLSTQLSRFNQLREMWGRKMREREEGPIDYRRRQAALNAPLPEHEPPAAQQRVTSALPDPYVRVAPGTNGEGARQLYEQLEKEHVRIGKTPPITYEQLATMLEKQSERLRERYHVKTVAFRVDTVDGKVVLKARPVQE